MITKSGLLCSLAIGGAVGLSFHINPVAGVATVVASLASGVLAFNGGINSMSNFFTEGMKKAGINVDEFLEKIRH